jgi:hypothetical protein
MVEIEDKIKSLLLTWDEYNKKKFNTPYTFSVKKQNQELFYFGGGHSYKPDDLQNSQIEDEFEKFILRNNYKNTISVIEGRFKNVREIKEENIKLGGESGLLAYLSKQKEVPFFCFEPKFGEIINKLLGKYSKDILFYYSINKLALQYNKILEKPKFENYLFKFMERDRIDTGWYDFDFSLENAKRIHKKLFNTDFDENDKMFFYHNVNPAENSSVFNEISKDFDIYRDVSIVKNILEKWQEGKNIFVVYGSGHAIIQERALKTLCI